MGVEVTAKNDCLRRLTGQGFGQDKVGTLRLEVHIYYNIKNKLSLGDRKFRLKFVVHRPQLRSLGCGKRERR